MLDILVGELLVIVGGMNGRIRALEKKKATG